MIVAARISNQYGRRRRSALYFLGLVDQSSVGCVVGLMREFWQIGEGIPPIHIKKNLKGQALETGAGKPKNVRDINMGERWETISRSCKLKFIVELCLEDRRRPVELGLRNFVNLNLN